MTTKQRLACGAAILWSLDARRQHTGNYSELRALEQAIVDRELMELVTGGLCDESVNSRDSSSGRATCREPRGTQEHFMRKRCGGQTDEPDRA
jgi:hypothetical protein